MLNDTILATTTSASLSRASYAFLGIGLLASIPALLSGGQQAWLVVQKGGLYDVEEKDGQRTKTLREKVKHVLTHALVNDVALALYAAKWYIQSKTVGQDYGAGGATGLVSGEQVGVRVGLVEVVLSLAAQGVFLFGASLGGALTYERGIGMALGKGKKA